ncbi:MAG: hypothetical protein LBI39_04235 [Puniceicoccales bacterium]|nr:hypothetical protein [Puniceicoccales bacterium]
MREQKTFVGAKLLLPIPERYAPRYHVLCGDRRPPFVGEADPYFFAALALSVNFAVNFVYFWVAAD